MPYNILSPIIYIDGNATPRAWEQAVNFYVKDGICYVNFPITSRGMRNFAFLREDDELVVVVPTEEVNFSFSGPPLADASLGAGSVAGIKVGMGVRSTTGRDL